MRTNDVIEDYLIAILDNRPMYRAGIKSILQSVTPTCRFTEHHSLSELPVCSPTSSGVYFFIRVGDMSDKSIIENVKKLRSACKMCKIILYDYQQRIEHIVNFFQEKIDAYLPDDFSGEELKECFSSLTKNRMYLNTQIAVELLVKTPNIRSRRNFKFANAI